MIRSLRLTDSRPHRFLLPILTVIMLVVMAGEAMLTAALPEITREFAVPGVFESWILPMVLLVGAAASPFIGTAGDQYGRKRILLAALAIYLAGLVCGYYAPGIWTLLLSRAMQGIGVASFPLAYALLRDQLPVREADVGIGVISATYGAGMFLGVISGSFLIEAFSWRETYLVLIPLSILLLLLAFTGIHEPRPPLQDPSSRPSLDWTGFISLLAALLLGLAALSVGDDGGSGQLPRILFSAGAVAAGFIFLREELRTSRPLVDLRLARQRVVLILILIGSLTILTFMLLLQEMPFLIRSESGLGLTAGFVGLVLMPGTLCDMLAGPLTGRMVVSRGIRLPCLIGSLMMVISSLILLFWMHSLLMITLAWMIFSGGMSVTATACMIAIIDYVPLSRTAEATGLMQSVQTVGGMVGPVLTGLVMAGQTADGAAGGISGVMPHAGAFVQIHLLAFFVCLLVLSASLLLLWRIRDPVPALPHHGEEIRTVPHPGNREDKEWDGKR